MITINDVWFPSGYSGIDHLLPDGDEVFADIIGRRFETLGDIKRAVRKAATAYGCYWKNCQTVSLVTMAEIVMANGDKRAVDV